MKEFRDKVAVVTGAASGIGYAMCERFASEGMKVVLADIEEAALRLSCDELASSGATCLAVPTDVSSAASVEALARSTLDAFGGVHLVCNNAGVITGGVSWEAPLSDYDWTLRVNLWGVIHGIRTFVPLLIDQGGDTHMVNTSSMAGLTALPFAGIYHMSKHAVVALSESLYHELLLKQTGVGLSVVCPEGIATRIHRSDRNRPADLPAGAPTPESRLTDLSLDQLVAGGIPPSVIAERTLRAVRENRFYVLAEDAWLRTAYTRLDDIRAGRNPTLAPPIDG